MEQEYDVVVLGTGLVECILSSLLSIRGERVLHMDRNEYYGGECASLTLSQLCRQTGQASDPMLGKDRDYNIDLVPKFIMAGGEFAQILAFTQVTRYLEFRQVAGSFVYRDGKIYKVPSTEMEALGSSMFGFIEKFRARSFFGFIQAYRQEDPSTHQGLDMKRVTMRQVYEYFGLEGGIRDFVGHALALGLDDSYIDKPAFESYKNIILYVRSMARFGKSPYIYPLYGLGELPQAFARLSAVHGGTYMLNRQFSGLKYENGQVAGVVSGSETIRCRMVIGDPTYFPDRVVQKGRVIRVICLLTSPIPGTNADSAQIIIPQRQVNRKSDIYIACLSAKHNVCPEGFYLACVSTLVETDNPEDEIAAGLSLLGSIHRKFVLVSEIGGPAESGVESRVFVSSSYDPSSHFESVCHQVAEMYKNITGSNLESLIQSIKESPERGDPGNKE